MSVKQAPEELLKKYTQMGFKKMWINKEFQRFCTTVSLLGNFVAIFVRCPLSPADARPRHIRPMYPDYKIQILNKSLQFEGRITDGAVPIGLFLEKSGTDEIESKIFSFLFDADGDGKISFEEVLQSTGFMETDGKYAVTYHSTFLKARFRYGCSSKTFLRVG